MDCSTPGSFLLHCLPEFAQIPVHWVSDPIQPSHPLVLPFPLPSIFPSIRVFPTESSLPIRRPDYWSFHFSISPSNEYSGLIVFRINWFGFLSVQGTLKCFLQHQNVKASVYQFFVIQVSHPLRTIGKNIALTIWTFVGKMMFLLFNTLSRFLIVLLPRRKLL